MSTPPPELVLQLADPDPDERVMCPSRRMNKWGWWAVSCTWPLGHAGTTHHDAHTSTTWKDGRPQQDN